jgi:hypothetical protein
MITEAMKGMDNSNIMSLLQRNLHLQTFFLIHVFTEVFGIAHNVICKKLSLAADLQKKSCCYR